MPGKPLGQIGNLDHQILIHGRSSTPSVFDPAHLGPIKKADFNASMFAAFHLQTQRLHLRPRDVPPKHLVKILLHIPLPAFPIRIVLGRIPYGRNCCASHNSVTSLPLLISAHGRSAQPLNPSTSVRLKIRSLVACQRTPPEYPSAATRSDCSPARVAVNPSAASRARSGHSPARQVRQRQQRLPDVRRPVVQALRYLRLAPCAISAAWSATNRAHFRLSSVAFSCLSRSHSSPAVLRCIRITMHRSASVSGRMPDRRDRLRTPARKPRQPRPARPLADSRFRPVSSPPASPPRS